MLVIIYVDLEGGEERSATSLVNFCISPSMAVLVSSSLVEKNQQYKS